MKRFLIISFIFLYVLNSSESQPLRTLKDVSWSDSVLLSWNDFIGPVDNKSDGKALTASSIIFKPYFKNDSFMLWVEAIFIPDHSWKKNPDLDSFDLTHEQTHFNITELFARKLRKIICDEITSTEKTHGIDLMFKIDAAFKKLSKECGEMQDLYDIETNYSINKAEQIKWNKSIWNSLEKFNSWVLKSFFIEKNIVYKE